MPHFSYFRDHSKRLCESHDNARCVFQQEDDRVERQTCKIQTCNTLHCLISTLPFFVYNTILFCTITLPSFARYYAISCLGTSGQWSDPVGAQSQGVFYAVMHAKNRIKHPLDTPRGPRRSGQRIYLCVHATSI